MKITNSEYDIIIRAINTSINQHLELDSFIKEAEIFRDKLIKEYNRIAEKNVEEGMTKEEEELYPSRLDTDYGGNPIGNKRMEQDT
tara:strand:- start:2739 stop:2996 length:258 start_codon:yes stop_codon:yes gene_type:complete